VSIDAFFNRTYNPNTYNCAHFVTEVWEHVTGSNIEGIMQGFLLPVKDRFAKTSLRHSFKRLKSPEHMALVLMRRPKTTPHVGLFYNGKVLQIERTGVTYLPLKIATLGFSKVSFYKCQTP
jgi:hypothetical protein